MTQMHGMYVNIYLYNNFLAFVILSAVAAATCMKYCIHACSSGVCMYVCVCGLHKALFGDRPSRRNLLSKGRTEASSAVQRQPEACQMQVQFVVSFIEIFVMTTRYYIVYYEHNHTCIYRVGILKAVVYL